MRRGASRGSARAGLTRHTGTSLAIPSGFRGSVFQGPEAARRASHVSGPFSASPPAYLIPADADDLQCLVTWADDEGVPLVPRGGGTGMPGGNLGPHVIVEVGPGFEDMEWVDREAGRIRLGAGVVAQDAERFAAQAGFTLPFLPSSRRWCRVGGMLANNAAGARSFRHGAISASVLSVEGVLASGALFRAGASLPVPDAFRGLPDRLSEQIGLSASADGVRQVPRWPRVRKNSSGYALDRYLPTGDPAQLLVGSEGTLAILTHVELRLAPEPHGRSLAVLAPRSLDDLTTLVMAAARTEVESCEFLGRRFLEIARLEQDPDVGALAKGAQALVLIEVVGSDEEIETRLAEVRDLGKHAGIPLVFATDPRSVDRLWELRHAASPIVAKEAGEGRFSIQFIEDSVVPPGAIGAYLEGLDGILGETGFDAVTFGHAGDGNVHVNPLVDISDPGWKTRVRSTLEGVTGLVSSLGGTLTGEHGDGRLRAPLLGRIWPPDLVAAFRTVKDALDPGGTLNPGVILPLPGQDPLEGLDPKGPGGLPTGPDVLQLGGFA